MVEGGTKREVVVAMVERNMYCFMDGCHGHGRGGNQEGGDHGNGGREQP
jgi:hypothetical protein